jgi:ATP-dependent DNA helicase RecQ
MKEHPHVFAALATAAGKSLLYTRTALLSGGTHLVIGPLISLMEDQVGTLPPPPPPYA